MNNTEFYNRCAELLGVEYICTPFPYETKTRWNNRKPGEGRYPGYGLIRHFGGNIHVTLRHPVIHNKVYTSENDVYEFLKTLTNENL